MADQDSIEALDAELACRTETEGRLATALLELESHPGHVLLSTFAPVGQTAPQWALAREALHGLWQDFNRFRDALAQVRAVRSRRVRPGQHELAELRRLLLERSVEIDRTEVALPDRLRTAGTELVEWISLDELASRMDRAFHEVSTLVVEVDRLHQSFLAEFAPLSRRLHAARTLVDELGLDAGDPVAGQAATLIERGRQLERTAATDPLSLAAQPDVDELAALAVVVVDLSARLAGIASVRDGWADALSSLNAQLSEVEELYLRTVQNRRRVLELIENAQLTAPRDRLPELRRHVGQLSRHTGWTARAEELDRVRVALREVTEELRATEDLGTGLMERRSELRGRFEAYQAKAARLGCAEHPDLLRLDEQLRRLLWTRPCDLAAATRALASYQRLISPAAGSR